MPRRRTAREPEPRRPAGEGAEFIIPPGVRGARSGFRRWPVVDESAGSVHTGFGIGEMEPGGSIDPLVHSLEESPFVLDGEVVLRTPEMAALLRPGDYGHVPVGVQHALRNEGTATARLASMAAPVPRGASGGDTYFVPPFPEREAVPVDIRDPRTRSFDHIDRTST